MQRNIFNLSSICDVYDHMSQHVSVSPDTVAELVKLQNYVAECRDVTMYNLREQTRLTAEYVQFLMTHALLSRKHKSIINRLVSI